MTKFILVLLGSVLAISSASASEADLKSQIDKLNAKDEALQQQLQQVLSQSKEQTKSSDVVIGGYGEIGLNTYSKDSSRNQIDLKRFVITLNKSFSEKLSFSSEVEWEHAVTSADDQGESEIEQAYLNYQASPTLNLKMGLFLMPFGLLNESHEPPVYYGVERNEVETRIIPSTWREGGLSLAGSTDSNLDWSVGLVTGFDVAKFDDPGRPLAAIHQELQLAKARDLSYFATLNYKVPGFVAGVDFFTGNSNQGNADYLQDNTKPNFDSLNAPVTLGDVHARYQQNSWDIQAVLAKGTIGQAKEIDQVIQNYNIANATNLPVVASEFYGWLVQAAYVISLQHDATIAPFGRYEEFNTQSEMPTGFVSSSVNYDHALTTGLSYKPVAQVVFKADYQNYNDHSENNRFNLGMGYMF
ncbi:MAG: hypothetical protein ACXVAX_06370 [Pseudobdellovibrio sp.]